MPAKEVPAQKVLKGHFVCADSPTLLRLCSELPIDLKSLKLNLEYEDSGSERRLNGAFYLKLDKPWESANFVIATPIQRNVHNSSLGLEYAFVNLRMDLMAEDVVARARAQGWETTWEDETDYCDVNTGAMGRRQVGHVKFIVCDSEGQLRSLTHR